MPGQETLNKSVMGFTAKKQVGDEMEEIKRVFTPEFRNRLDATISFKPLDHESFCVWWINSSMQLEAPVAREESGRHFHRKAQEYLADNGFDPLMGARPMARLIQDTIRAALADELLFGRLAHGGQVTIDIDDEARSAAVEEMAEAAV